MLIGIKLTKAKSGPPTPSIFYCGLNAVDLRAEHAKLLAENEAGVRFFYCHNPMMIPLQNVAENTEDHPDQVAAQKRRAQLAVQNEALAEAGSVIRIPVTEGQGPETPADDIIPIPGNAGSTDVPPALEPETENSELETITPEARRAELTVLKHADLRGIAEGIKNAGRPIALTTGTKAQLIEAILASEISTSGSEVPPTVAQ